MDTVNLFQFLVAFIFVIGLIYLFGHGLKRYSGLQQKLLKQGADSRLGILEIRHVDPKHKLILIRRDDKAHLIMISATGVSVIENDIPVEPL